MEPRVVIFDAEANNLLPGVTKIWLVVAEDIANNERFIFSDETGKFPEGYTLAPLADLPAFLSSCDTLAGHNIIMYDSKLFRKILGYRIPFHINIVDTMIWSQVLDYKRFGFGHGLAMWGKFFKKPKPEHDEWDRFSDEMITRCVEDVEINVMTYRHLMAEFDKHKFKDRIREGLRVEHGISEFVSEAQYRGFPFDKPAALALQKRLQDACASFEEYLVPRLMLKAVAVDGYQESNNTKDPVWTMKGDYNAFTARWFGVEQSDGQEDRRTVWGTFTRVAYVQPDVASPDSIKAYLYSIGWVPDDWNYKKTPKGPVKTSEKITSTSLALLGHDGFVVDNYLTSKSRLAVLNGWIEGVTPEGRLHGECFVIGTPTGRSVHKIIANIPKADTEVFVSDGKDWIKDKKIKADLTNPEPWLPEKILPAGTVLHVAERAWGPQIRALFVTIPGYQMVGADSSGNQFRALCHYLGPDAKEYTRVGIEEDIHNLHASILSEVVPDTKRGTAKPFFYAYIFGGGDGKIGLILTGARNAAIGKKAKDIFAKRIPGFARLVGMVETQFQNTKSRYGASRAYIPAIDGRNIYCDSKHKALNYLLQSCEKVTCAAAATWLQDELNSRGWDWQPLINYHDEMEFLIEDAHAEEARELAALAYAEAPKAFGITIMAGEAKIGKNWAEVH
jgi:DNA polymerase I-like protein with 3'-5' exonuclease and polymerase domains